MIGPVLSTLKKTGLMALLLCMPACMLAQEPQPAWQQVWQQMTSIEDVEDEAWQENYELLLQLAAQPLNLNTATREELEQLPFLSQQQVMGLMEYRDRYGPLRSMGEVRMVPQMDYQQLALLPYFVYVDENTEEQHGFPSLNTIGHYGHHTLTATGRLPLYDRRGDENGYLGYKYRHSLRYEFHYGDYMKAGIIAAQDAGEPFFANGNRWGYDFYSYYLQIKKLGCVENAVVGRYKVSAGMGLVMNTSFSLGKLATLQSLGRHSSTLRPHSSRSEADYFQGAAATLRLSKPLRLTLMASHRPMDATLNDDGSAATLITSGYHRTPGEMAKKHNTHLSAVGTTIAYRQGGLHLGLNTIYTHLDRSLEPNRKTLYRRHYAHGTDFLNVSADYGFDHHLLTVNGETAIDRQGAIATVNSVSLQPSADFSIMALQRFYSYRYTGLYSHSFSAGSRTQNESGVFLGTTWNPAKRLHLQAYVDYAYMPWARYQASWPSHAWDFLMQGDWQARHWSVQARYRMKRQQKDNEAKTTLIADNEQRSRLAVTWQDTNGWRMKTQADYSHSAYKHTSNGWMLSEQLAYEQPQWQLNLTAAYFNTDDYSSRIYIYEHLVQHDFAFPAYYGQGMRLALYGRLDLTSRLRLAARLGYTNYFDRHTIGTELQQIDASHQTDLDLQLRWKF